MKMASTIRAYKTYILAWYDHYITNGTIEGINNKIKVLKRQIYGFRNEEYFKSRLYALHDRRLRITSFASQKSVNSKLKDGLYFLRL